jgi:hypothetical protein
MKYTTHLQTLPGFLLIPLKNPILAVCSPFMSSYWVSRSLQPSLDNFTAQIAAHRMMLSCGIYSGPKFSIVRKCYPNWGCNRFYSFELHLIDVRGVFICIYGLDLQTMVDEGRKKHLWTGSGTSGQKRQEYTATFKHTAPTTQEEKFDNS